MSRSARYAAPSLRPLLPRHIDLSHIKPPRTKPPPAVPFFRDPQHTIPTKWSLYRPLLRFARGYLGDDTAYPSVGREVKRLWKSRRSWTSVPQVRTFLQGQYDILSAFQDNDISELDELEARLANNHRLHDDRIATKAALEAAKPRRPRPRIVGFLRPTLFNPPLPRLKPQPPHLGAMIHARLRRRERRMDRRKEYASLRPDMKLEVAFWKNVLGREGEHLTENTLSPGGWDQLLREEVEAMDARFVKENKRADMVYDETMYERIESAKKARSEWWTNKKAELKAERLEQKSQ
ncbi:hypothetical protein L198_00908 [Cryptococcus wingfieldii CBS 7118]|uniref:Uncharacterized protein n=1 Tax=Cryptococcus wingfieldii CBS 7118 TaxID=1295528 RepID=A0A1E3K2T6_9TREE|nr:hypothetical protein L198_00908 [Cryptococcus wingfieldii CBS 7118]ODO07329.1 hypothetical protein L198_00908 [Cryptococcus wingfieldii CBS 7118]